MYAPLVCIYGACGMPLQLGDGNLVEPRKDESSPADTTLLRVPGSFHKVHFLGSSVSTTFASEALMVTNHGSQDVSGFLFLECDTGLPRQTKTIS